MNCPLCGGPGYLGLDKFKCDSLGCKNGPTEYERLAARTQREGQQVGSVSFRGKTFHVAEPAELNFGNIPRPENLDVRKLRDAISNGLSQRWGGKVLTDVDKAEIQEWLKLIMETYTTGRDATPQYCDGKLVGVSYPASAVICPAKHEACELCGEAKAGSTPSGRRLCWTCYGAQPCTDAP